MTHTIKFPFDIKQNGRNSVEFNVNFGAELAETISNSSKDICNCAEITNDAFRDFVKFAMEDAVNKAIVLDGITIENILDKKVDKDDNF